MNEKYLRLFYDEECGSHYYLLLRNNLFIHPIDNVVSV